MKCLVLILVLFAPSTARAQMVEFGSQIVPLLTRSGCNAGACHGAAAGRGNFKLSLFGSNADADYEAIAIAFEGRRINLTKPELSLVLAKPSGRIDHGGDVVFDEISPASELLTEWIRQGALRGRKEQLTEFLVDPPFASMTKENPSTELHAFARFGSGEPRDVTQWTVFQCDDTGSVELQSLPPRAKVLRPGVHVVTARFLDRLVPVALTLPFAEVQQSPPNSDLAKPSSEVNVIDRAIERQLGQLGLTASPNINDHQFARRVYLDLTGRLPNRGEIETFAARDDSNKRSNLVEQLLASPEFTDIWTLRFSRWLRMHEIPNEEVALERYAQWLRESLAQGKPFDVMARELLLASGDSHQFGAANFARMFGDARSQAELVGTFFMGTRIQCANCHNHPLDRWTQDDYHGLAAIFSRVDRGRIVRLASTGSVTNPRTGESAIPRIPGIADLTTDEDPRIALVDWLTKSPESPMPKTLVNRLWQVMFGQALVEPIDDMRQSNLATHPELLDWLAKDFVSHDYDIRYVLKLIATSDTYSRSVQPNSGNRLDSRFYSHRTPKSLEPEVLLDAMNDVLGMSRIDNSFPIGQRAVQIVDPQIPSNALDALGRCSRGKGCTDGTPVLGLASKLHMINGELINSNLSDPEGRLQRAFLLGQNDEAILNEFYWTALSRSPTKTELLEWQNDLEGLDGVDRSAWFEDFVWGLLNSREFRYNQ